MTPGNKFSTVRKVALTTTSCSRAVGDDTCAEQTAMFRALLQNRQRSATDISTNKLFLVSSGGLI